MPNREWELVPGVSSLISKRALTIRLCSDVRNTEKSIMRRRSKLPGGRGGGGCGGSVNM